MGVKQVKAEARGRKWAERIWSDNRNLWGCAMGVCLAFQVFPGQTRGMRQCTFPTAVLTWLENQLMKKGMMMKFYGVGSTARWGLQWRHDRLSENGKDQQQSKVNSSSTFLWPLLYSSSHGHGKFYYPARGRAQVRLPFPPMLITRGSGNGHFPNENIRSAGCPSALITTQLAKYSQLSLGLVHLQNVCNCLMD